MAVLLVVLCHTLYGTFAAAGPVGVTVFFVLSGFLITTLLLDERERTGRVDFASFYRRRALRLFPAVAVFLVVILAVRPLFGFGEFSATTLGALLLYSSNWATALGGHLDMVAHTWSLAVEEQFYIAFPLAFVALLRRASRQTIIGLLLAGVFASDLARVSLAGSESVMRAYAGTDTNAAPLLLGCLLAVSLHRSRITWTVPAWVAAVPLAALVPLCLIQSEASALVLAPIVAGPLAVAAIFLLMHAETPPWLTARWLVLVGKRSYGFYLWHYPPVMLATILPLPWWTRFVAVAVGWGLACVSWRCVELPFLRMKNRRPIVVPVRRAVSATTA